MPWVTRSEFNEARRESERDRRDLHEELRDTAEEVRALRRDLRLIAKVGLSLVSTIGLLGPTIIGVIALFHKP